MHTFTAVPHSCIHSLRSSIHAFIIALLHSCILSTSVCLTPISCLLHSCNWDGNWIIIVIAVVVVIAVVAVVIVAGIVVVVAVVVVV